jgi:hypothetical protein
MTLPNRQNPGKYGDVFIGVPMVCITTLHFFSPSALLKCLPVLDKVQSLYQGRPPYLRVLESDVPMTFVDDFEEFEPFHGDSFSCLSAQTVPILCHHISQLQMYASLCIIMERIHVRMHRMRDLDSVDGSTIHTDIAALWQALRQWRADVPTHLSAFTSSQSTEEPPLPNAVAIL